MSGYTDYTRAQVRAMLQQKYEDVPFWVDTEANDAINEALLVWNSLTGTWKDTEVITTTANNWDYALSASIVFGITVTYENRPLAMASRLDMDAGRPLWQSQTTADGGSVPTTPQFWIPMSIDLIGIWPADAVGGHTLRVLGISATPVMDDDADTINIGYEDLNALLNYSLHILTLKEGGERFATSMALFKFFLAAAAEENDQLNASSIFRQFIGIDMARQELPMSGKGNDYQKLAK